MKRKHTLDAAIHSHAMIVLRLRSDIKLLLSPLFFYYYYYWHTYIYTNTVMNLLLLLLLFLLIIKI